jgi:hypothetical protein
VRAVASRTGGAVHATVATLHACQARSPRVRAAGRERAVEMNLKVGGAHACTTAQHHS